MRPIASAALFLALANVGAVWTGRPTTLLARPGLRVDVTHQQQRSPVEIPAVVFDDGGDPVLELTRDDFAVEEDGVPVTLSSFSAVNVDAVSTDSGRTIELLLDDARWPMLDDIKKAANALVASTSVKDRLAAAYVGDAHIVPTTNHQEVLKKIKRLAFDPEVYRHQPRIFEQIARFADELAFSGSGFKAIVCIGYVAQCDLAANSRSGMYAQWLDAVRATSRANVVVYVISVQSSPGYDGTLGFASQTGGHVFLNTTPLPEVIKQIWNAAGHYYLLGYTPPAPEIRRNVIPQVGTHDIRVRVKRPEGAIVWSRRSRA